MKGQTMKTVLENPNFAARRARQILEEAYAYYDDVPAAPVRREAKETPGYIAYFDAA